MSSSIDTKAKFKVGEFVEELLVTDTVVYQVVESSEDKLELVRCTRGKVIARKYPGGNPMPIVYHEAVPGTEKKTVQCRGGVFKTGSESNPLRQASTLDGFPVFTTDYSF